jgi:hypothetical protein
VCICLNVHFVTERSMMAGGKIELLKLVVMYVSQIL